MVNSIRRDNDIKCPDCKGVLHVTIRKSLTETSVLTGVKADNSVWVRIPISEKKQSHKGGHRVSEVREEVDPAAVETKEGGGCEMDLGELLNKYTKLLQDEEKENKAITPDKKNVAWKTNSDARVALLKTIVDDIEQAIVDEAYSHPQMPQILKCNGCGNITVKEVFEACYKMTAGGGFGFPVVHEWRCVNCGVVAQNENDIVVMK